MNNLPKTWQELKERLENAPKPKDVRSFCICGQCEPPILTDEDYQGMFKIIMYGSNTKINWDELSEDDMYVGIPGKDVVIHRRANRHKDTPMT